MKSPRKNRIGNGHKQLTEEKIQMAKKEKTLNFTINQRNKFTILKASAVLR